MSEADQTPPPSSPSRSDSRRAEARQARPRGPRMEITAVVIAVLLALGVVVAALDMKFQADQARWQQRQTCLEYYRLQADYGLGPWYEKLPAAAADCGGGETDDGTPIVPGGSMPAVNEADRPTPGATSTTTTTTPPTIDTTPPSTFVP